MAIHIKKSHEGRLHRALHVAATKQIPYQKLESALHSSNPRVRREARFAENARHWKHK